MNNKKCPECQTIAVEFDTYFRRLRCFHCGWMSVKRMPELNGGIFKLCDYCFGDETFNNHKLCEKCNNTGKILTELGKEVAELIRDMAKLKE